MTRPLSEIALGQDTHNQIPNPTQADTTPDFIKETINQESNALLSKKDAEQVRLIAESTHDLVCMHDVDGKLLYVASTCHTLLAYTNDELINKYPKQFVHPNDLSKTTAAFNVFANFKTGNEQPRLKFQFRALHKNGNPIWLECQLQGIFDKEGNVVATISTSKDISQYYKTAKQLSYHATHDLLTGLNNRRLFKERLSQTLESIAVNPDTYRKQISVLHIDLDRFKIINESLGHQIGDHLLRAIAQRIRHSVHFDDIVARLGGDEFAILLFDIETRDDATKVAERLQAKIQQAFRINEKDVFITASIGVVFSIIETNEVLRLKHSPEQDSETNSSTTYTSVDAMMGDAELSMYHSKTSGKARYTIFNKSLHSNSDVGRRLQLEGDLRTALSNKELFPLYHPILSLPSNKLMGFEVLLRWQHPEFGLISPAEFIPIAEDTGAITPITLWLLEKACGNLVAWQEKTGYELKLSINLSPSMFSIPDIDTAMSDIIEKFPLNPSSINLEITEGLLMEDMDYGAELLNRLRSRGIRTHIDDFGTGYCSLSYLHSLPIDALKIDKSFISGDGALHSGIVQTIISLAHNLDIPAIAEGIEDTKQLSILNTLKCDQAQGFLFSKPISVVDVNNFLEQHTSSGYIVGFKNLAEKEMPRQNINGT